MNDWDNLDNFPTDDDDNDDLGLPDWLSDMDVPDADDEAIEAAKSSLSSDDDNDDWGVSDDSDDLWGSSTSDDDTSSDDIWSMTADDSDADDDSWLTASDESDDDVDDFLFGASADDSNDDSWLTASDESDDDVDDFLFGASADDSDDDSWLTASDESDDDVDDFLFGASADDSDDDSWLTASDESDDDVDDFLFGTSSDDSDSDDFGDWGELGSDIGDGDLFASDGETTNDDSGWGLTDLDENDIFSDEPITEAEPLEGLGVPDWLEDMPVPGEEDPIADDVIEEFTLEDSGEELAVEEDSPDWLEDMPVPGESVQAFNLDELGDDWLEAVDEEIEAPSFDDDDLGVPDWLAGAHDSDAVANTDDNLANLFDEVEAELSTDDAVSDDLTDLLGGFETEDSDDLSDLLASLDTDDDDDGSLDDLLASLDVGNGDDDASLDDLFASLEDDASEDDAVLDDLFASIEDDTNPEADLDFLGDVDTDSEDDLDFLGEVVAGISDEDDIDLDFLGEMETDPEADLDFLGEVDTDTEDDLDFLRDIEAELEEIEEEPVNNTNYLTELFGEEEEESLDLELEEEIEAELEPEPVDGFSFFDDIEVEEIDDEIVATGSSSTLNFLNDEDEQEQEDDDILASVDIPHTGTLLGDLYDGKSDPENIEEVLDDLDAVEQDQDFDDILASVDIPHTGTLLGDLYDGKSDPDNLEEVLDDLDAVEQEQDLDDILASVDIPHTGTLLGGLFDDDVSEPTDELGEPIDDRTFLEKNQNLDDILASVDIPHTGTLLGGLFDESLADELPDTGALSLEFDFDDEEYKTDTGSLYDAQNDSSETDADKPATGSLAYIDNIPEDEDNDDPDWLDEISGIDTDTLNQAVISNQPASVDIDALIDSFEDSGDDLYQASNTIDEGVDLDSFFDDMDANDQALTASDLPAEAMPAWLQEIADSGDEESAASLLRERENRSLDDLDDRLLDLRERGLELTSSSGGDSTADQARLSKIIPNIDEALVPASMTPGQSAIVTEPTITPQQAQNAAILQNLVGSSLGIDTSADQTTSSNVGKSILDSIVARADRLIIAGVLIIAVLMPFVYPAFGNLSVLPQNEFAEDSPEFAAFTLIEDLNPNDYVLIGAEYGAAGARELDTATRSLMEHIIINGGIPVIVSSDAVGLLRTENIVVDLLTEDVRNAGYYVAGLIPGGNVGLRDFAVNLQAVISTDLRGNPINLDIESLDDFSAIVVISESGESVRNWMEQIAPVTTSDIIVVTGQSARPIALPYVDSIDNVVAMLTSYDDAYTYQQMSLALYNPSETPVPSATLSPTPTLTPTVTNTPLPSPTDVPPTATDIPPTATDAPPTATDLPATDVPTDEPTDEPTVEAQAVEEDSTATDAPTDVPTEIPTQTPEPEVELTTIDVAVITAESNANVRAGAGTGFSIVGTVAPGDNLAIIDRSVDDDWVQIVLPDGNTAWIATILIDEIQVPSDEFEGLTEASDEATVEIGTVVSDARVNVRAGAGSDFAAVAGLDPDAQVRIIGTSTDGDWYNIVLPNGGEGWIASFLLSVEEIPASDWDGASKDGFFPVYFSPPITRISQDDNDEITVGRNASGITVPIYEDNNRETVLTELENGGEFIVIEAGEPFTQILLEDGQIGFIETRLIVTDVRQRDEVDFAPTLTPTLAPTETLVPTATLTPSPSPTATPILPEITPMPPTEPQTRSSSQALGLLATIVVIALGNLFWILRWLGQRDK